MKFGFTGSKHKFGELYGCLETSIPPLRKPLSGVELESVSDGVKLQLTTTQVDLLKAVVEAILNVKFKTKTVQLYTWAFTPITSTAISHRRRQLRRPWPLSSQAATSATSDLPFRSPFHSGYFHILWIIQLTSIINSLQNVQESYLRYMQ